MGEQWSKVTPLKAVDPADDPADASKLGVYRPTDSLKENIQWYASKDAKEPMEFASAFRANEAASRTSASTDFQVLWKGEEGDLVFGQKVRHCHVVCEPNQGMCDKGSFCDKDVPGGAMCMPLQLDGESCSLMGGGFMCVSSDCHMGSCQCKKDSDCLRVGSPPTYCLESIGPRRNKCVACKEDSHCAGDGRICDKSENFCYEKGGGTGKSALCLNDDHCKGKGECLTTSGFCSKDEESNIGEECRAPSHCAKPYTCGKNKCVECVDHKNCRNNEFCDVDGVTGDDNVFKCMPRQNPGAQCDFISGDRMCNSDSCFALLRRCQCKENKHCKKIGNLEPKCKKPFVGPNTCVQCKLDDHCSDLDGKTCDKNENFCYTKGGAGISAPCLEDKHCKKGGMCLKAAGHCSQELAGKAGDACGLNSHCKEPLICYKEKCRPLGQPGDACTEPDHCAPLKKVSAWFPTQGKALCISAKKFMPQRKGLPDMVCSDRNRQHAVQCEDSHQCADNWTPASPYQLSISSDGTMNLICYDNRCLAIYLGGTGSKINKGKKIVPEKIKGEPTAHSGTTKEDLWVENPGSFSQGSACVHAYECRAATNKKSTKSYFPLKKPSGLACIGCINIDKKTGKGTCKQKDTRLRMCTGGTRNWDSGLDNQQDGSFLSNVFS